MKVTFPYMGPVIGYKKMFDLLGHDVVMPPKPSKETIDLGVKYSPEFACFIKVLMGSYIPVNRGRKRYIFSSGGHGPCRAGFYGKLHSKIIKSLGYDTQVIIFDEVTRDYKDFISKVILVKVKIPG